MNLAQHFLIAMPDMDDGFFTNAVVYLCVHDDNGAVGLCINKGNDLHLQALLQSLYIQGTQPHLAHVMVGIGGPVQRERGFVLHEQLPLSHGDSGSAGAGNTESDNGDNTENSTGNKPQAAGAYASTLLLPDGLQISTSLDVLHDIASGTGPTRFQTLLGYAAWSNSQLEAELQANMWLTVPAQPHIVFDTPLHQRYDKALALLGIDRLALSTHGGRA